MIVLLKNARECPRRFWEAFGLLLLAIAVIAWAASADGWFAVVIVAVCVWSIFCACMAIFTGQHVAYLQALKWAEEVRQAMDDGQVELASAMRQLDSLVLELDPRGQRFQGPS